MISVDEGVLLSPLTTFEIGGPARFYAAVRTLDEIREALAWAAERAVPYRILAGGSNVLINDSGFDGLVVHIVEGAHEWDGEVLTSEPGCDLLALIRASAVRGLGGWESMAGIPGTIGGAVRGNAGAFGTEIKDLVEVVEAFHAMTGIVREFSNAECEFAYRSSFFKQRPEWVITSVQLRLRPVDAEHSAEAIEETIAEREKRHLQNVRAAGSFFTNPVASREIQLQFESDRNASSREGRVPAGWLIDKSGFRGVARVGGAVCSAQHADYLVNDSGATAADVRELSAIIKAGVLARFGVELVEEADVW